MKQILQTHLGKALLCLLMVVLGGSNAWAVTYKLEKVTSVEGGSYYVFEQNGHVMDNNISSSALQTTSTYSTNNLTGSENYVWLLEQVTNGYKLKNVSINGNNCYLKNSSSTNVSWDTQTNASVWSITFDNDVALISNTNNSNRFLGYTSNTSYAYKAYATSNLSSYPHTISVYKLVESTSTIVAAPTFSPVAGTYTSAQSITLVQDDAAMILYTTDGTDPSYKNSIGTEYSTPIPVSETTTIKAIAVDDDENESSVATATYTIVSLDHAGTQADPYTVADARAAIDANTGITGVYVSGIVCEGGSSLSSGAMNYWISDDGTETNKFEVYKGKGLNNADFSATTDVVEGAEVVVYGDLQKYNSTYEFSSGNYLTSYTAPTTPTIATSTLSLSGFTYETGNGPSDEKTFIVSGVSLTAGIALSLGENSTFEISTTSGSGFGSSVNLASDASDVTVYVRLKSDLATGSYNGTVTLTSTSAADVEIGLSGSVTAPEAAHVTWDLSTDQTTTASSSEMTWTSSYASMEAAKGDASTATNNYYPGTSNNTYTSTRFYKGSNLTITPASGYAITSVVFTATSTNYATTLGNSTWTNASASADQTTVTVTPTNGANAFSATIGGTCGFTEVKVYYEEDNTPSISVGTTSIQANCTETEGTIDVTYNNIADNSSATVYFCDSEGASASYDWIDAEINNSKNIYYVISANSSTERTAYMKVKVGDVYSQLITINQYAYIEAAYYLVTSITSGKHYVIASGGKDSGNVNVMSTQNTNNRTSVAGTVSGTGLSFETDVVPTEVVIYGPDADGYYTIYDEDVDGYLYAASSSANHLKTQETNDDNGRWKINFSSNVASITAQGSNTRNEMKFNSQNSIFSCYASGQSDVYLYEKANEATPTENVTVTSAGYATYCSENALDFTNSSIKAYVGTREGDALTFSEVTKVPARTGVLLVCDGGATENIPVLDGAADDVTGNCLTGVTEATTLTANDYILNVVNGGAGFYKAGEFTALAANRAYIPAAVGGSIKSFGINLTTGIALPATENAPKAVFDLSGRRVEKPTKGLYIVNGKKVLF